ncbi:hypothetical protein TanjilG_32008 [Lupinus angustifolius]|uniref:RNA polymerase alpha subunit C-terminal domain-containing protein n=1 Tax=Lupinus angustifolius TaxID=3871 RepID=A0A1J7FXT1_LUPAN|nr:hypothetical protein TanjilG_00094 [Lupinus angustifolius]OIW20052.1 hypothetical protein TanjilG_32008 [Lupinus angustifolius]
MGSRKNGRIGSRKHARKIPKGVIHVQASFNNTIVTVTDVRGRVISWSSAGTCGFKGTRRGTPFAAQTAAANAILTVADQGMQRAEVMIKGPGLGRDAALRAIRRSGQADTIGIAMRRVLLGEIEGTCITRAKSEKIPHEYSTLVEPINLCIGLEIARNRGYRIKTLTKFQDRSYPIDAVFMSVRNANHSIHSYVNGNEKQEILFLEIWTNGSLTPKEALFEASRNLIDLFIPFLHADEENLNFENNQHKVNLPPFTFDDLFDKLRKNKKEIALKSIFIDQLELSPRIYNCLKRSNIHTLFDLLNNSQEDLIKIEHFRVEDVKDILDILEIEKHFT